MVLGHQVEEQGVELRAPCRVDLVELLLGQQARHLVDGHRHAHPAHRLAGPLVAAVAPVGQHLRHQAQLVGLGGDDLAGVAAHGRVLAVGRRQAGDADALVVVGGHVLQEADVDRVGRRGVVAGGEHARPRSRGRPAPGRGSPPSPRSGPWCQRGRRRPRRRPARRAPRARHRAPRRPARSRALPRSAGPRLCRWRAPARSSVTGPCSQPNRPAPPSAIAPRNESRPAGSPGRSARPLVAPAGRVHDEAVTGARGAEITASRRRRREPTVTPARRRGRRCGC